MGVDYRANYGIGIGIQSMDFDDDNINESIQDIECMDEFLDYYVYEYEDESPYRWFQTGEGDYTGDTNDFFVVLKKPFANGFETLEQQRLDLLKFLD